MPGLKIHRPPPAAFCPYCCSGLAEVPPAGHFLVCYFCGNVLTQSLAGKGLRPARQDELAALQKSFHWAQIKIELNNSEYKGFWPYQSGRKKEEAQNL